MIELIHTEEKIKGEDSAFTAAKRGKDTSMWLAIESVKEKSSDIVISAGNTGALLIIAKLNLNMIENIDKQKLSFEINVNKIPISKNLEFFKPLNYYAKSKFLLVL